MAEALAYVGAAVPVVVGSAVVTRDLVLLGVGTLGTLVNVPAAATRWTSGSPWWAEVSSCSRCG